MPSSMRSPLKWSYVANNIVDFVDYIKLMKPLRPYVLMDATPCPPLEAKYYEI